MSQTLFIVGLSIWFGFVAGGAVWFGWGLCRYVLERIAALRGAGGAVEPKEEPEKPA